MQCILSAMKAESAPVIDHFNLKRERKFSFPVFSNSDLFLIGIGIGKKKIANRINSFIQSNNNVNIQFINIGIAGAKRGISELGNIYCIHKIIDHSTNQVFYPDILIKHFLEERVLTTVEKEINDGGKDYNTLVDMEASEIFRTCSKIVPLHNLFFYKIISDHLSFDSGRLNYEQIKKIINVHIGTLERLLVSCKDLGNINSPILTIDEQNWIQDLTKTLSLTKTQNLNFTKLIKGFRLKNPNRSLPKVIISKPISKFHRNQQYKDICEKFTS